MATDRITVRLPRNLRRELVALKKALGKSESELVRDALEEFCRRRRDEPTCYDIALRMGLVGASKKGPRDLSTNPKHMEGFG
jgi:metal-responsive CopG/Arc/MetJ family transcriptional regulator